MRSSSSPLGLSVRLAATKRTSCAARPRSVWMVSATATSQRCAALPASGWAAPARPAAPAHHKATRHEWVHDVPLGLRHLLPLLVPHHGVQEDDAEGDV